MSRSGRWGPKRPGALRRWVRAACLVAPLPAAAPGWAAPSSAGFDPLAAFAPLTLPTPPGATRSAGGRPAPGYWQNRADYRIEAAIDTASHRLTATETITYTNNSPDALDVLWVQLDQNIYRRDARAAAMPRGPRRSAGEFTDGYRLGDITVQQGATATPIQTVTDTRLQLRLPSPLAGHGGRAVIHIAYSYTVPGDWGGRTAVTGTPHGDIYEIAQWFPRMAVYDDLRGWDTAPYLGSGEFYLEYGDIDYAVTVPSNYIVAGSGSLVNPEEVLTAQQRDRLARAASSDSTIVVRAPSEVGAGTAAPDTKTWRFHMAQTRDVAFAASPAFVWDAARINLPGGGHALAMSVYPPESAGAARWGRSTEYVKFAIEHFSARWFTYPWPVMVNLGGHGAGMEYPGIVFDDRADAGRDLFWITTHEVGHSWFPMIVGSNERRDAWMDEGSNTFIDVYASDAFNHGEYAPKRDPEYAEHGGNPADEILPWLADAHAPIILTPADQVTETYRHPISYFKPALGLVLLREQILGPPRFDAAFRAYIAAWAYKHPSPSDFFRFMSSEAGEDLAWWWRGWYFANETMDVSLDKVTYVGGDPAHGLSVVVSARDRLVMPVTLEVRFTDGTSQRLVLPVEAFFKGGTATVDVATNKPVRDVTLDPDHALPDSNRTDKRRSVG